MECTAWLTSALSILVPIRQPKHSRSAPSALVAFGLARLYRHLELWNSWIRWAHSSGKWEIGRGLDKVDFGEATLLVVAPGCAHVRGDIGDVRLRLRVLDPWVDPKASHDAVGEVRGVAQCLEGSRAGDHRRIVSHRVIRGK